MNQFSHDLEHEQAGKSPRAGRWNRNNGSIVIRCPVCKSTPSINAHTIAEDGSVSPSVVCTGPGCSYHEFIRLEGYLAASAKEKK